MAAQKSTRAGEGTREVHGPTTEWAAAPDSGLQMRIISSELITYVVGKIVERIRPRQVILFGSQARNEATASSDLDLLVVQDSQRSNRAVRREIKHLLWGRSFGLDLIVRTPEDIERNVADNNPFYTQHVLAEGKVLYERPT